MVMVRMCGGCVCGGGADGWVDLLVNNSAPTPSCILRNLGNGVFAPFLNVSSYGSAVAVDTDGDGDLDIPAWGVVNPTVDASSGAVSHTVLFVRLLGRAGGRNQYGARVTVSNAATGAIVSTGTVDAGASFAQGPYDIALTVPNSTLAYNVRVSEWLVARSC